MGEVFRGPGFRVCARAVCSSAAVAVISFDYATKQVWMDPLPATPEPSRYDICETHADRFRPPYGWTYQDRRPGRTTEPVPELFEPDAREQVVAQIRPEPEPSDDEPEDLVQNELFKLPGV